MFWITVISELFRGLKSLGYSLSIQIKSQKASAYECACSLRLLHTPSAPGPHYCCSHGIHLQKIIPHHMPQLLTQYFCHLSPWEIRWSRLLEGYLKQNTVALCEGLWALLWMECRTLNGSLYNLLFWMLRGRSYALPCS